MIWTHVGAAVLGATIAGSAAWQVQDWRYGAKEAERLQAVREQAIRNDRTADAGAAGHEVDRARIRKEFITINREAQRVVEKPVYRNVCLDDDGLRILERAINGEPAAGESASALSGFDLAR